MHAREYDARSVSCCPLKNKRSLLQEAASDLDLGLYWQSHSTMVILVSSQYLAFNKQMAVLQISPPFCGSVYSSTFFPLSHRFSYYDRSFHYVQVLCYLSPFVSTLMTQHSCLKQCPSFFQREGGGVYETCHRTTDDDCVFDSSSQ